MIYKPVFSKIVYNDAVGEIYFTLHTNEDCSMCMASFMALEFNVGTKFEFSYDQLTDEEFINCIASDAIARLEYEVTRKMILSAPHIGEENA